MSNEKNCNTCAFENGRKCKVLREKISYGCFAWADADEAQKRDEAIEKYSGLYGNGNVPATTKLPKEQIEKRLKTRKLNQESRGGKSVKEILDLHFNLWYQQGLNDAEIGEKLHIHGRHICDYRNSRNLPPCNKKNRPAETEAAM